MIYHDLFVVQIPLWEKVIRTVLVYAVIVVLIRIGGKRDLAQVTSVDLVVVLLLSNVVQNAIIGADNSLLGGVIGAAVLIALNAAFERLLSVWAWLYRVVDGSPTTLVTDGHYDRAALRREGLRPMAVEAALRRQNANDVSEVQTLMLDPGGFLVTTLKPEEQAATKGDLAALEQRLTDLLARS